MQTFIVYVHSPLFLCLARPPFLHRHLVFSTFHSRSFIRSTLIMSQPQDLPLPDDDDTSHVSTPILGHPPGPSTSSSSLLPSECSTSADPSKPTSALPTNAHLRLPIPTPSANLSQTSFTFVNVNEDGSGVDFDDLPPEVTSADISIAREFSCSTFFLTAFCPLGAYIPVIRAAYLTFWAPFA